jgi:predicted ribosome quality control (RQC) complex YloA/Tae2 family protein
MGKHSNLILVDGTGIVVSAAKPVGPGKSVRPVLPGRPYAPPPFPVFPPVYEAKPGDDLARFEGASPFLRKLVQAAGCDILADIRRRRETGHWEAWLSEGHGAYPLSLAPLGLPQWERSSFSSALEQHYDRWIEESEVESARRALLTQLERVRLAREAAIADLRQAADAAARARELQERAELILAYGPSAPSEASLLEAWDYQGNPVQIRLDPTLDYRQNAQRLFDKAKHAKSRAGTVVDQLVRMETDLAQVESALARLSQASTRPEIERLREASLAAKWLHRPTSTSLGKEDRPYEGKRVRELIAPGGWTVLFGENAEANDYLTLRVARPDDWWLHVRGGTSAHVVVPTHRQPEKVPLEVLLFAAQVAVQNSPSKHSRYVAVDCTLRKHVRRPKGAKKGMVLYSHEKTLHVGD